MSNSKLKKKYMVDDNERVNSKIINETSKIGLEFNVMPNKTVSETFTTSKYELVSDKIIEAHFNREYVSEMKNSPSHVIFLTMLIHFQKLAYIQLCRHFGFPYDPHAEEIIKVWPTELNTKMPVMIEKETNLIQRFELTGIRKLDQGKYLAEGITSISGSQGGISSRGVIVAYVLPELAKGLS